MGLIRGPIYEYVSQGFRSQPSYHRLFPLFIYLSVYGLLIIMLIIDVVIVVILSPGLRLL